MIKEFILYKFHNFWIIESCFVVQHMIYLDEHTMHLKRMFILKYWGINVL